MAAGHSVKVVHWKERIHGILKKIIALEPSVPKNGRCHDLKTQISELAEELAKIGASKVIAILEDPELKTLLKSCQCKITCGYTFSKTDFWAGLCTLARKLDDTITLERLDGVTFLFQKTDSVTLKDRLHSKTILFVGEDDFSFTRVFIATHRDQTKQVIASTYGSFDKFLTSLDVHTEDSLLPMIEVIRANVVLAFGVDATKLNEYPFLKRGQYDEKFERIQFNCPFADDEEKAAIEHRPKTKKLIADFLTSATPLLDVDRGRLHLAMQQPKEGPDRRGRWGKKEYQTAFGVTPTVTAKAGLTFVKVLGDIEKRYEKKVEAASCDVPSYYPYIGQSSSRVNQFIFKPGDYFEYETDSGDSEDEIPTASSAKKRRIEEAAGSATR